MVTVADLASRYNLKKEVVKGEVEYHGSNPWDTNGAQKEGFWIKEGGTAFDRKLNRKYTSNEVADNADIDRNEFEPNVTFKANGPAPRAREVPSGRKVKPAATTGTPIPKPKVTKQVHFNYEDESGELLYQALRLEFENGTKTFRQRRRDNAGEWIWSLDNVRRVLMHLPFVPQAKTVYIHEGETCAEAHNDDLKAAGLYGEHLATTSPQGAGNAHHCDWAPLAGKDVVIVPDNDEPGEGYCNAVATILQPTAARVRVVRLPDRGEKGDYKDFRAAGHTHDEFIELVKTAPLWRPASRFKFLSMAQVENMPSPAWLIHRLLVSGDTSLLTAKHSSFKSFFALDMALCVAYGFPWHGYEVRPGRVIYVAGEGVGGLKKRIAAWRTYYGMEPTEDFLLLNNPLQIHDEQTLNDFIRDTEGLKPVFIVLDTLARCTLQLEENSAKDMGLFADAMDRLAKASGAHVMAVHHNNKGGEYRGSSAVPAAVGTHISMERSNDNSKVALKIEKQKDDEELPELYFDKVEVSLPGTQGTKSSLVFRLRETSSGGSFYPSETQIEMLAELINAFGAAGASHTRWKSSCEEGGICKDRTFNYGVQKLHDLNLIYLWGENRSRSNYLATELGKAVVKASENGTKIHLPGHDFSANCTENAVHAPTQKVSAMVQNAPTLHQCSNFPRANSSNTWDSSSHTPVGGSEELTKTNTAPEENFEERDYEDL